MTKDLGAILLDDGRCRFRVWAPLSASVHLHIVAPKDSVVCMKPKQSGYHAALVEGLMWTAIAAAALTRFLAHMPPLLAEVPMSTRKVAMCALHVLGDLVEALKRGDVVGLYAALEAAITSLARHAQRAHPKRDRRTGRAQLGLEPCFEHDDVIEFAEAA